jgi:hypothetical protein
MAISELIMADLNDEELLFLLLEGGEGEDFSRRGVV